MTDSCKVCGKTSSLMNCKRCKSVAYCSADCQRRDWKTHKQICQRTEFAGAPCDCCGNTEDVDAINHCVNCGSLYCKVCNEQQLTRDLSGQIVSLAPCTRCNKERDYRACPGGRKKLEKLIKESPRDPRLAYWLVHLGYRFTTFDEEKAKEHFLRAGELGFGEGFARIAEIYMENQNWDEARRYYRMAADRMHVLAICNLATEASLGYFNMGQSIQEDHRRAPDLEKAFRLWQEGARLGHAGCCALLGRCYHEGEGTEVDCAKGFKWSKKAAEKGDVQAMHRCGNCYLFGKGVEQSHEQAIYWYEKCVELEDNEDARTRLSMARLLSNGSS